MTSDARLLQALLRSNFQALLHKVFYTLNPSQTYVPSWHIDAIAFQLERVYCGELRRLIINMPPRSLKSIAASVAFPSFVLGRDPTKRIICVSYSNELSKKHSNDFRAVIGSTWYQSVFPGTRVGSVKDTESEIEFTARGYRMATSVGGTLTGRGGDIVIIDDPLKPSDAHSEAKRTAVNVWFNNTLLSRLDDKRQGAIIIVMQRFHTDDLTGFLLGRPGDWEILTLPAIATCDEVVPIAVGKNHCRKAGEALFPEREPLEVLEKIRLEQGSDEFNAQYQQDPAPAGGVMVKRHWVKRYSELPATSDRLFILQSWDTASKGGPDNDWSVCTTWFVTRQKTWYLLDVWRKRVDYPALKAAVLSLTEKWKPHRVQVEDTGTGTSLVQELRGRVAGIIAVKPEGDKISRMAVASAKFEAGQVFLPERAPWLADLESELFSFPGARHDDQCDSISQALLQTKFHFMDLLTPEQLQRMLEDARRPGPYTRCRLGQW